ncbi:hypothetical protein AAFC00_004384 [Neodothiora populina]|uniref:beta-glucosidase n=1 Tax=Neodothiora populina TaxID=2781224 RepID=A0ABR3PJI5_9PEZI
MADINVEDVLSKLSDHEKLSLLAGIDFWHTKSLPEHGVPSLRLSDGPNGVRGIKFFNGVPAACFPCGTALGATFDKSLLQDAGRLMGDEAKAKGAHVILGPTINMQRSPLGGRGFESIGEDPVLAGLGAAALINGIQENGVAACLKHFVCNDQEHQRNLVDSIITQRALREIYLLPFQLAVRDAFPKSFMTAYNKVNGTHVSENPKILEDILRKEWAWHGLVMSDWYGTYSVTESINAGLDLEMPGPPRFRGDAAAHASACNKFNATALDDRARNILQLVKDCAASGIPENAEMGNVDTPETSALLRRLASESIVLLKNEQSILPLDKTKKVLVIGPNANVATYCGGGSASLRPYYAVTPLDAIKEKVSPEHVIFTIGAHSHKELPNLATELSLDSSGEGKKGVVFRAYNEAPNVKDRESVDRLELESTSMMFMDYKNPKIKSLLWYADVDGYLLADHDGEYEFGISVYGSAQLFVDGKLTVDVTDKQEQGSAFFGLGTVEVRNSITVKKGQVYHVKCQIGSAPTSKLQGGSVAFGGGAVRIGGSYIIDAEEEIRKAADLAKDFDQVVVCAGLNMDWESEGFDRPDMKLPGHLDTLISSVAAANPKTVVVMQSGTPVEMPWLEQVPALLQAWYGGNETGNGIADVLFGDVNPSGHLSLSFPVHNEDNPAFLNYRSEAGRVLYGEDVYIGYRYYEKLNRRVSFPFGHGLSYTSFRFSDLSVTNNGTDLAIEVTIKNTGVRAGAQVAQVYISQDAPAIARPKKELKGFSKVLLQPGQSDKITVEIPLKYACSYFDEHRGQWILEKGAYKVLVADSSEVGKEGALEGGFEVERTSWWSGV